MLHLTPSRLRDYLQCPLRYHLRYVAQVAPLAPVETPALAFGSSLHAALKAYHRLGPTAARRVSPVALLSANWWRGQYEGPEQEAKYFDEGVAALDQYLRTVRPPRGERIQTEVMLTQDMPLNGERTRLRGRVDHLAHAADGGVLVLDYKTSARGLGPSEAGLAADLPTFIYYLLGQRTFQRARRVVVAQLNLRTLDRVEVHYTPTQQARNEGMLADIACAVQAGPFDPHPSAGCPSCPVRLHCPAFSATRGFRATG